MIIAENKAQAQLLVDLETLCSASINKKLRAIHILSALIDAGLCFRIEQYPGHTPVNILIEFGKQPHLFVVGGHYDTIGDTAGANDNGMGVLALIQLAKNLKDSNFSGNLTIALFDNEENLAGGGRYEDMGSYCYIEQFGRARRANQTLILDVIGVGDTPYISHTGTLEMDERVFEYLTTWTKSIPPSDNICFMDAGWPVWLLCAAWKHEVEGGFPETYHRFHSPEDTTDQDGMNPGMVLDIVDRVHVLVRAWNHLPLEAEVLTTA